ncbi:hypothetical protein [Sphingobacterium sp. BS-2]|uniref:hypothetical protein n=1 Tax=Sphingobacterium sp. BS-2 TaxID=3377129 RepID=UPI0038FC3C1E
MGKDLTEKLMALIGWYDSASMCASGGALEDTSLSEILTQTARSIQRMYFLRKKQNQFEREFRKVRNTILYMLKNLSKEIEPDGLQGRPCECVNLLETFLGEIDERFSQHLNGNDPLSKRMVTAFQRELDESFEPAQVPLPTNAGDTIDLLKKILSERLERNPSYGVLKKLRDFMDRFKHVPQSIHHPPLTWVDANLILLDYRDGLYLSRLLERVKRGIEKSDPCEQISFMESFGKYLLTLKRISRFNGIRKNRMIGLLEQFIERYLSSEDKKGVRPPFQDGVKAKQSGMEKITCNLSADQLALILRAMDESRLVGAKSMNAVFRQIIPFLSTDRKVNLSYGAVRSKAYSPEDRDRQVAVGLLEKMIEKIQSY